MTRSHMDAKLEKWMGLFDAGCVIVRVVPYRLILETRTTLNRGHESGQVRGVLVRGAGHSLREPKGSNTCH